MNLLERTFQCSNTAKKLRIIWFISLSSIFLLWNCREADQAHDATAAITAKEEGFSGWWHGDHWFKSSDAVKARNSVYDRGFVGLVVLFVVSHVIALVHESINESNAKAKLASEAERERREFDNKMLEMNRDSDTQASRDKAAQSKQELIKRLGSIDQYILALEAETDDTKRTMSLQGAHSELVTLAANLASHKISRDALDAPEVREHAAETSHDLTRLGLSDHRLNRDIKRMFKLNGNGTA